MACLKFSFSAWIFLANLFVNVSLSKAQLQIPHSIAVSDKIPFEHAPRFVQEIVESFRDEKAQASFESERDDSLPRPPQSLEHNDGHHHQQYQTGSSEHNTGYHQKHNPKNNNNHHKDVYHEESHSSKKHEAHQNSQTPYIPKLVSFKKFPEAYPSGSNKGKEYYRPATRIDQDKKKYTQYVPPRQRDHIATKVIHKTPVFHDASPKEEASHEHQQEEDSSKESHMSSVEMSEMFKDAPGSLEALVKMDSSFLEHLSPAEDRQETEQSQSEESEEQEDEEDEVPQPRPQTNKQSYESRRQDTFPYMDFSYFMRPIPPMPPMGPANKPGPPYQSPNNYNKKENDRNHHQSSSEKQEKSESDYGYDDDEDHDSSPSDDNDENSDYYGYDDNEDNNTHRPKVGKPQRSSSRSVGQFYSQNSAKEEGDSPDSYYDDDKDKVYRDKREILSSVLLGEKIARSASNPQVIKVFRVFGNDNTEDRFVTDTRVTVNKKGQPVHITLKSSKLIDKDLIDKKPKCSTESSNSYCLSDLQYPIKEINQALDENKKFLGKFRKFIDSSKTLKHNVDLKNASTCPSLTSRVFLKRARNVDGQWHTIVNVDRFSQPVIMQTCRYLNAPCKPTANSQCIQKYSLKRLLAYDGSNLFVDKFLLPSSCSCLTG